MTVDEAIGLGNKLLVFDYDTSPENASDYHLAAKTLAAEVTRLRAELAKPPIAPEEVRWLLDEHDQLTEDNERLREMVEAVNNGDIGAVDYEYLSSIPTWFCVVNGRESFPGDPYDTQWAAIEAAFKAWKEGR